MSLIALKFVWSAMIVLLIVVVMWLAAELLQAPPEVKRMAGWILGIALVIGLVALLLPIAGGLAWLSFGVAG